MTVAGVATNAETLARVVFIESDSQRHVKWLQTGPFEILVEMLNALFVTYCRVLVRCAGPGFGRILAAVAVHVVEVFGLGVVGFEFVVADGPGRRDAAVMTNLSEVFFAQTEECRAVEFRVATDE